ncbi:MAG: hypothetical protein R6W67_04035 [Bacteroidales bacterium]
MKRTVFLAMAVILALPAISFSQISRSAAYDQIVYLKRENFMASSADTYRDVKGTPYLMQDFVEGKIYTKSGDVFPGEYRFDIFANRVQFMNNDVMYQVAYPDSVSKIEIGETTLKYVEYTDGDEVKKGYFIVIEDGECLLLRQKNKVWYDALPAKPYQTPEPPRFGNGKDLIFLKNGDAPAEKVAGEKDVLRLMGPREAEAKRIIDREKLKVKKEEDLLKLIKILNEVNL